MPVLRKSVFLCTALVMLFCLSACGLTPETILSAELLELIESPVYCG